MTVGPASILPWLSPKRLELIILPTEKCNLRCTYCYERFKIGRMRSNVQEAVCRLIQQRQDLQRLDMSWFGGEPLVGLPVVRKIAGFAHEFAHTHGIQLNGSMTTNGYLLEPEIARWLIDHSVRSFQISLDGNRATHDQTRRQADGRGTFDEIFKNLSAIAELTTSFRVMLRVHYHQKNIDSVSSLIELLANAFGDDSRFSILFRKISPLGSKNDGAFPFMTDAEATLEIERRFIDQVAGRLRVVNSEINEASHVCYACKANSLVIRADGRVAKCTVALYNDANTIGQLRDDGTLELDAARHQAWLQPLLGGSDEHRSCPATLVLK